VDQTRITRLPNSSSPQRRRATGGVVNSIDNRIPKLGAQGLSGRAEVRFGGAAAERAGAAVLEPCDPGEGILATHMKSDGALAELLCLPGGGSRNPLTPTTFNERTRYIKMKGDGVFKWAVRAMVDASHHVLEQAGYKLSDVSLIIPHQANIRIIEAVSERLEFPRERIVVNLDRYGNTSSATIPVAFDEVVREKKLKPGELVLFTGFGGGFTWGSVLVKHAITL